MNKKKTKSHVLLKWKSKQQIKFVVYQNKILWFSTTSAYNSSYFPQNSMPINSPFFSKFFFLDYPKSHHHDQNQKEFKIQTNKVPWLVPILNALFIQNYVLILPP
jgi:hypothetical protein